MEEGKYYFVYFPVVLTVVGRQSHVIKCSSYRDSVGEVDCENFYYFSTDIESVDDTSCGGQDAIFCDAYRMGHYYELDDTEMLIYVMSEIV